MRLIEKARFVDGIEDRDSALQERRRLPGPIDLADQSGCQAPWRASIGAAAFARKVPSVRAP